MVRERSVSADRLTKTTDLPNQENRRRFAFALRIVMGARDMTSSQLARQLGRSPNTVGRWTRGETLPTVLDVGPLSDTLAVDQTLFIDPPPVPEYPLEKYLNEKGKALLVRARQEGRYLH